MLPFELEGFGWQYDAARFEFQRVVGGEVVERVSELLDLQLGAPIRKTIERQNHVNGCAARYGGRCSGRFACARPAPVAPAPLSSAPGRPWHRIRGGCE